MKKYIIAFIVLLAVLFSFNVGARVHSSLSASRLGGSCSPGCNNVIDENYATSWTGSNSISVSLANGADIHLRKIVLKKGSGGTSNSGSLLLYNSANPDTSIQTLPVDVAGGEFSQDFSDTSINSVKFIPAGTVSLSEVEIYSEEHDVTSACTPSPACNSLLDGATTISWTQTSPLSIILNSGEDVLVEKITLKGTSWADTLTTSTSSDPSYSIDGFTLSNGEYTKTFSGPASLNGIQLTGGTGAGLSEIEIYTKPNPVTPTRCTAPSNCGSCTNEECNERYRCYLENNVCKFNPCGDKFTQTACSGATGCIWSGTLNKCIPTTTTCSGSCTGANCVGTYSVVNGVCKCLEANGNECIILPPSSHTECSSSQCKIISGAGTNTCTSSSQCTGTSHKECSAAGDCVPVSGAGMDLCTDDGQCNPTTEKHKGCTTAQQCIELAGTGADRCTGNADCTETDNVHKACIISNGQLTCLDVSGNAIDLCGLNNPCGSACSPTNCGACSSSTTCSAVNGCYWDGNSCEPNTCQSYTTQATCPTATCEWSGTGTSNPQGGCCPKGVMKWNIRLNPPQCGADFCTFLFPAGCGRQGTRITPDNCAQVNLRKICWQSASELPYGFWVPYNSY